jgi:hypothetical protein
MRQQSAKNFVQAIGAKLRVGSPIDGMVETIATSRELLARIDGEMKRRLWWAPMPPYARMDVSLGRDL